jgi:alpha-D-ribose 1-methylphosphonate 5-triphosphate synthase subunit PhnH
MAAASKTTSAITPGFQSPVFQSQAVFRTVMAALAEPGQWLELASDVTPPPGLPQPAALALLTLADFETPVWLPPHLRDAAAGSWLRFHCNCPLVSEAADAMFAVWLAHDPGMPPLSAFSMGDDRFPDRSATILVVCNAREGGTPVRLTGPGIQTARSISPTGLPVSFWSDVADNANQYPLGLDFVLLDGTHILGLPRSTRIDGGV